MLDPGGCRNCSFQGASVELCTLSASHLQNINSVRELIMHCYFFQAGARSVQVKKALQPHYHLPAKHCL